IVRNIRRAPRPGGADDRACRQAALILQPETKPLAVALHGFYFAWAFNRKPIAKLVAGQIVDHLVACRKAFRPARWHRPAGKRAVTRGRKQAQRVPCMTPGAAGPLLRVQHDEIETGAAKV